MTQTQTTHRETHPAPPPERAQASPASRARRVAVATFTAGVVLLLAIAALTLAKAPPRLVRIGAPGVRAVTPLGAKVLSTTTGYHTVCQSNEVLPAGISAIRLSIWGFFGARVHLAAYLGARVLTEGSRSADWTSDSVTVPVRPLRQETSGVRLCFAIGPTSEPMSLLGAETHRAQAAVIFSGGTQGAAAGARNDPRPLQGRMTIEYLAPGRGSWWSRALSVARRMGLGRAYSGTWIALLVALLTLAAGVLAVRLTLRDLQLSARRDPRSRSAPARPRAPERRPAGARSAQRRQRPARQHAARSRRRPPADLRAALRRVPRTAWICASIALLNATAWSIITPPFQGRDEIDHYAYVAQLAETGQLPHGNYAYVYSPKETYVTDALDYYGVRFTPYAPSISTAAQQQRLIGNDEAGVSLRGPGSAGGATHEPPLYYALQTIPYALGAGNVLAQLQLMRLFGALMGAITAMLVFFFLREVLPGAPWAATVGAVCAALQPTFAFTTGTLNPDSLLYVLSAAAFLCLALGFRRQLTIRLAIVLGLVIAAGFLTYFSFIGVAFGAFLALVALAIRDARAQGRAALRAPAVAVAIGLAAPLLDGLVKLLAGHPAFGQASKIGGRISLQGLFHEISYVWELFLPRLPGMSHYFNGISTWREVWFDRSVGLYGWMDTMFPGWVDSLALVLAGAVALLCGRELVARRQALRARLPELLGYAAIVLAVLAMLGVASYSTDVVEHELAFGEPRYLLPMLPLLGAMVALAVRGAGRRWMPLAGAAIVVLFIGHDVFSQLQVIARYYG